jgi:hypothetical protein
MSGTGVGMQGSEGRDVELATSRSLIEPNAAEPARRSAEWKRSLAMGLLFLTLSFVRAIHPTIITASKSKLWDGTTGFAYSQKSPICIFPIVLFIGFQFVVLALYGKKGWLSIWTPTHMLVFGISGVLFSLHDYLEMECLSKMHGAAYQILSQSKILITAFMMMPAKGVYQSRMQWMILLNLMVAMSVYMCIVTADKDSNRDIPFIAYFVMLFNVSFSCMAAVYSDKYAKKFAEKVPVPVQLVQLSLARIIVTNTLVNLTHPDLWSRGFFHGWDIVTIGVVISFCCKVIFTYAVVAVLDALMKNMAECVAVLLIFFYDVLSPFVEYDFHLGTFLSVLVIVGLIGVYVESKSVTEKANKYEDSLKATTTPGTADGHPAYTTRL